MEEPFELPETFTAEKREKFFQQIASLYDFADAILKSAMRNEDVGRREKRLAIVTPYLTQMRCSTDILATLYNEVAFNGLPITTDLQDTCETAFRNAFYAFDECFDSLEAAIFAPDEIDPGATSIVEVVTVELPALPEAEHNS